MIVKKNGKKYRAAIYHDPEFNRDYPTEPYEEIPGIDDEIELINAKLNTLSEIVTEWRDQREADEQCMKSVESQLEIILKKLEKL